MRIRPRGPAHAPPPTPAPPAVRSKDTTVYKGVLVALGAIVVLVAIAVFAAGSRSFLLLPLVVVGGVFVVVGARLERVSAVRNPWIEIHMDRPHRNDDR